MNNTEKLRLTRSALLTFATGILALLLAYISGRSVVDSERTAARVSRKIERRVGKLDDYMRKMSEGGGSWVELGNVPQDMVIYRYLCDTLQCWSNQFPIMNDDIRGKMRYQRLVRPEFEISSPLQEVGEELSFVQLGPKWYLVKWMGRGNLVEVIGAIEVCTADSGHEIEDFNRKLGLRENCEVFPVGEDSGGTVTCNSKPLFIIKASDHCRRNIFASTMLRWLSLMMFMAAAVMLLRSTKKRRDFFFALFTIWACFLLAVIWSRSRDAAAPFFSPSLYAGQGLWKSFGMLLFLNLCIFLSIFCLFIIRNSLLHKALKKGRLACSLYGAALVILTAAVLAYTILSVRDLLVNSGISLELQWRHGGLGHSVLALLSYSLLMEGMMMLLYMSSPYIRRLRGRKINMFSPGILSLGTLLFTGIIFTISLCMGFDKEKSRVEVWANRLAVDRNLSLELQIRSVEDMIASDVFIPALAELPDAAALAREEISQSYFSNINDYYIDVSLCANNDAECNALFNSKLSTGTPLAPGSRFFCGFDANGRSYYAGTFMYITSEGRILRMLIELKSKASKEEGGYYGIFSSQNKPGEVMMPEIYSYAKFIDGKLASYKGSYAYPTILIEPYTSAEYLRKGSFRSGNGYRHFLNKVSDNEIIVVSRRVRNAMGITTSVLTLYTGVFIMMLPLMRLTGRRRKKTRHSLQERISWTMTLTITIALVILAAVSVKFVFDRNSIDSTNIMSEKISAIQNIMESRCSEVGKLQDADKSEWMNVLQDVAATTKSDISLFTPKGLVYVSTSGEMYAKALLTSRMNGEAYHSIMHRHQRMCLQPERSRDRKYYSLYAPIFNSRGETIAIVNTPYNRNSEIMREALPHAILLCILLLTLIAISSTLVSHLTGRIFKPISQLSHRMSAGTEDLQFIEYHEEDELGALVDSYNGMVRDLAESKEILARNERDKAWSEMARQVAHEIKNPLTPMSLEIQKLVFLKQAGNPLWSEKFDNSARIILEQISILTDTANEFSTFAKLYSEDPVELDLDQILRDQVELFSNRENIEITYLGLPESRIFGPKPQLVRVFVNLLTNATQAIEIMQRNAPKNGEPVPLGKIGVELRNDISGGCYEIAVSDNGPGVSEANRAKLFSPNFTTKSGGTGLGLAICRNIVEKCNGSISYQKSFTLGGACFTVRLPKNL